MNEPKIQHLIVLMLENRSFDHMLGYLEYPPEVSFNGLCGREATLGNRLSDGRIVFPRPNAGYSIDPSPGHSHENVMTQLFGQYPPSGGDQPTNTGFAADFETIAPRQGENALQCFTPERLPILATLAKEFAVCDHWFCAVPGATWPNRNFAHAATSDGEVDIHLRSYTNKTIFEQLSEANRDWAIYYAGFPPQTMAFTNLWASTKPNWLQRFKPIRNLYRAIRYDRLPGYAFVEPDMLGKISNSQHPGMGGEMDFRAAEQLIWQIYTALRENVAVFNKTLFLITYDEHGGFFDHIPPPQDPRWSVEPAYRDERRDYTFKFDLLGPRVPAVLISPWIAAGTVDNTIYDHSSIPATVRRLFQISEALTARDGSANTFERALNLDCPREVLPQLEEPFVDEAARSLVEGVELRESLEWIVRELVWTQVLELPEAQSGLFAMGGSDLESGAVDTAGVDSGITDEMVAEIGSQLSAGARELLLETEAPPAFDSAGVEFSIFDGARSRLATVARIVRLKVERLLENRSLVDDAALVADWFLRKFIQDHNLILHTADGFAFTHPSELVLRDIIQASFTQQDSDVNAWLADDQDRWLTIYSDGRVTFHDIGPERVYSVEKVDPELALQLTIQMSDGDIPAVRGFFQKAS